MDIDIEWNMSQLDMSGVLLGQLFRGQKRSGENDIRVGTGRGRMTEDAVRRGLKLMCYSFLCLFSVHGRFGDLGTAFLLSSTLLILANVWNFHLYIH